MEIVHMSGNLKLSRQVALQTLGNFAITLFHRTRQSLASLGHKLTVRHCSTLAVIADAVDLVATDVHLALGEPPARVPSPSQTARPTKSQALRR